MKVEYSLCLDDLLAFHRYAQTRPALMRSRIAVLAVVGSFFVFYSVMAGINFALLPQQLLSKRGVGVLVVVALFLFLGLRVLFRQRLGAFSIRRAAKRGLLDSVFARRELQISADGIKSTTEMATTTWSWRAVRRIVVAKNCAFFILDDGKGNGAILNRSFQIVGLILPMIAFRTDSEFDEFVETARHFRREVQVKINPAGD